MSDNVSINLDGSYTLSGKFQGRPFVTYGSSLAEVEYHRDYLAKEIDERQRRELNERKIVLFPRRRARLVAMLDDLPPGAA